MRNLILINLILIIITILFVQCNMFSSQQQLNYDVSVALQPDSRSLSATAVVTFEPNVPNKIEFRLLKSLRIIDLAAIGFDFDEKMDDENYRSIIFTKQSDANKFRIVFNFSGEVFNMPRETNLTQRHSNSLGIISDKSKEGIYLPAGSFYPYAVGDWVANFKIEVKIDKSYSIVLSGNKLNETLEGDYSLSKWETPFPVDEVTIVGGQFQKYSKVFDNHNFNLFTYDTTNLADKYLESVIEHYKIYTELFGDYPFNEFSIVENFFATGFGMPGYTLLSGRLLAMPFVALSPGSLAHEFVHNWWGNSVYVDYDKGNWCEALTTFCSNYYYNVYKNKENEQNDWRKKALLAIDDLPNEKNYPVREFKYQRDMFDAVVGYSKGAFIFYEIYKLIGREKFFDAMKDLAKNFRGKRAYWDDLINIFAKHTPNDINNKINIRQFINDWLDATDVPAIEIAESQALDTKKNKLELQIKKSTNLVTTIEININRNGSWENQSITLKNNITKISINNPADINEVLLDQNYTGLRKLFKWEKPYTFNKILSNEPIIVLPNANSENYEIAKKFYDEMISSGYKCTMVTSESFDTKIAKNSSIIALGNSSDNKAIEILQSNLPSEITINDNEITYNGGKINIQGSILMANVEHPYDTEKYSCIINFDKLNSFDPLRRLFHYQSYSLALLDIKKPGKPIYSTEIFPKIKDRKKQILKIKQ